MKEYYFLYATTALQVLVQCIIPSLVVKKLDKTLIMRTRQDNMEMCRIFNEENEKNHVPKMIKSYRTMNKRFKRDVNDGNIEREDRKRFKRGAVNDKLDKEKPVIEKDKPIEYNLIKEKPIKAIIKRKMSVRNKGNLGYEGATMKYAVNPALRPEDARRVESIVDKLYDDLEEKGQKITYRQVQTTSSVKAHKNKTVKPSRRFDFAPALLTGPEEKLEKPVVPSDAPFDSRARWKHGIIPYFVDSNTYDAHLTEEIMKAFDYFEKTTCIRLQKLREKPTDKKSLESVPWLYISNPTGIRQCVHSNEKRRINGVQMTVFGYDCMSVGDIVHEVMHILGYSHEHLRSDRDKHISVLWDNIKPGYKKYFDINTRGTEYALESLPYDYRSILHYPQRAFSKNGKSTILAEAGMNIGQREGLSEVDVEKVALIYSNECVSRNREYLLQTCPSVVKAVTEPVNITQQAIEDYFRHRLWPYGIINYKLKDKMEFTVEERENINAVFRHIEQETCLQFRDVAADDEETELEEIYSLESKPMPIPVVNWTTSEEFGTTLLEVETTPPEVETTPVEFETTVLEVETTPVEVDTTPLEFETTPLEVETTSLEAETTQQGTSTTQVDADTSATKDKNTPETTLAPLDNDVSADNDTEVTHYPNEKEAKIIITRPKKRLPYEKSNEGKKALRENEIDNEISVAENKWIFKKMNISMKKKLLKQARANKNKKRRNRRDTQNIPQSGRRHAKAMLVLKRSPALTCECPEPGTPNGEHVLEVGAGCFNSVNDLLHFFVHILGLDHQHNMHDRDNYLHIVWDNIAPDLRLEMEQKLPVAAAAGFSYDYQSVMHYPWLQIKNGKTNIMYPVWNDGWAMGHWQGLSSTDVQKLNLLYFKQCSDRQKTENQ